MGHQGKNHIIAPIHTDHEAPGIEHRPHGGKGANEKFITLRVSPPAHPEKTPRRFALVKGVLQHAM